MKLSIVHPIIVVCCVISASASTQWAMDLVTNAYYNLKSQFGEFCSRPSIEYDKTVLRSNLQSHVIGQPLLLKIALPILHMHLSQPGSNTKALVLSFHGTPGSGKNHAAKIIVDSVYRKGFGSRFVHLFKPVVHFAHEPPAMLRAKLQQWIMGNVTSCRHQMFIFDEVNDMPEGVLEAVKPFIDYNPRFGGLDYSDCIFIFISNIGMVPINRKVLELWKSGTRSRESLEHEDFTGLIIKHAFNENGGMKKCNVISSRLIDAFIPFLPLEKSHVAQCVRNIVRSYSEMPLSTNAIDQILEKVEFSPSDLQLYSTHGCKNLETLVKLALIRADNRLFDEL